MDFALKKERKFLLANRDRWRKLANAYESTEGLSTIQKHLVEGYPGADFQRALQCAARSGRGPADEHNYASQNTLKLLAGTACYAKL
jgi:hypothetical protein